MASLTYLMIFFTLPAYRKVASSRLVYYSIFEHFWGATNGGLLYRRATIQRSPARDFTVTLFAKNLVFSVVFLAKVLLISNCKSVGFLYFVHPPLRKIGFLAKARLHYLHTESAFSVS